MTNPTQSLINFGSVDSNYPVAGQDNNSQGFRDNFGAIKTALGQSSTEITALQNNAAFVNSANNFGGNTLTNAVYNQFYGTTLNLGTVASPTNINISNGPVQSVTLGAASIALTFTNWPTTGKFASVRLLVYPDGNGVRTPTFSTENAGAFRYASDFPQGFTVGGESVSSVAVSVAGTGYTGATNVAFSGGGLQLGGTQATGHATYTGVSATVSGGFAGNGYAVNDVITVNSRTDITMTVNTLNLTFTATTSNSSSTLSGITNFTNLAAGVAISGTGIQAATTIVSVNVAAGTLVMSAPATASGTGITVTYVSTTGPIGSLSIVTGGNLPLPVIGSLATSPLIGSGYGARVVVTYGIGTVVVDTVGDGYTSAPNVVFTSGGGVNTVAAASITSNTSDNPKVIEAWTIDAGAHVFMKFHGEFN